jgi:hypothetical protein
MESYIGLSIDVALAVLTGLYLAKLLVTDFALRHSSGDMFQGGDRFKRSLLGQEVCNRTAAAVSM